jgi:hypothetical protein
MRIDVQDPELVTDLIRFLKRRPDAIAERVGASEVEASLLGSYRNDVMEEELSLRVRDWEAERRAGADARARIRIVRPAGRADRAAAGAESPLTNEG